MVVIDPLQMTLAPSQAEVYWPLPDMSLLEQPTDAPPVFPLEILPPEIANWAALAAQSKSAPVDYLVFGLFAHTAGLIGNACKVSPWYDWKEPANLWVALVGLPSSGKTPSQQAFEEVLTLLESELGRNYPDDIEEYQKKAKIAALYEKKWKSDSNKALEDNKTPPIMPREAIPPKKPTRPRLKCEDVTIEALAKLLADNPRGLIQKRDELSGWINGMGRYSGSEADKDFWLEAWNGKEYVIDRVKLDEPIQIPRVALSVMGGIQPDKIKSITTGSNDGFSARLLYIWPASRPPKRPTVKPDHLLLLRTFKQLLSLPVGDEPRILAFSEAAAQCFEQYRQWMYGQEQQTTGLFLSFLGKQAGIVARLSLTLELLKWSVGGCSIPATEISLETVEQVIRLSKEYLIPMGKRVFEDGSKPLEARHADSLARWIMDTKPSLINARDVYRKAKIEGVQDSKAAKAAIAELVAAHWLLAAPSRKDDTTGRQRSDYQINPRLWDVVTILKEGSS